MKEMNVLMAIDQEDSKYDNSGSDDIAKVMFDRNRITVSGAKNV